jgi:hypothetical protein
MPFGLRKVQQINFVVKRVQNLNRTRSTDGCAKFGRSYDDRL